MQVEVFLTGASISEEDVKGRTVIVVDVLRTSSTITAALDQDARAVVPVPDMAAAGKIAANLDPASYLMGGERSGEKIEGYHLNNSPLAYTKEEVAERTIILNTSNGTPAIYNARAATHLVTGSFLNASRVVSFAQAAGLDLVIVCAGWGNRVSLEDTLCAGLLLHLLWGERTPDRLSDTAYMAYSQYENDREDLHHAMHWCNHARRLREQGREEDLSFCIRLDAIPNLPYYKESRLELLDAEAEARVIAQAQAPLPANGDAVS